VYEGRRETGIDNNNCVREGGGYENRKTSPEQKDEKEKTKQK
jgi:hypothetical protein